MGQAGQRQFGPVVTRPCVLRIDQGDHASYVVRCDDPDMADALVWAELLHGDGHRGDDGALKPLRRRHGRYRRMPCHSQCPICDGGYSFHLWPVRERGRGAFLAYKYTQDAPGLKWWAETRPLVPLFD